MVKPDRRMPMSVRPMHLQEIPGMCVFLLYGFAQTVKSRYVHILKPNREVTDAMGQFYLFVPNFSLFTIPVAKNLITSETSATSESVVINN